MAKWKLTELPELVRLLHQSVTSEQNERCRSLYLHYLVDIDYWPRMTEEQHCQQDKNNLKKDFSRTAVTST
ncbi:hypothetical protein ACJMK2_021473 [Sinanodonta woodiana]|uniref:Uncharacterized protein n=1 Tax=Sinanodonta woodiana TaxID=1069815 RepID=A0ABD3THX7_SINWO